MAKRQPMMERVGEFHVRIGCRCPGCGKEYHEVVYRYDLPPRTGYRFKMTCYDCLKKRAAPGFEKWFLGRSE